jgi:uncharacterized membrane protein YebE (DUF533 family)
MSFMRTLMTASAGFAAAKGLDAYRRMGGMEGLQRMIGESAASGGGMAEQMTAMMQQMGLGAQAGAVQDMLSRLGAGGAGASGGQQQDATMAGLGGLLGAMTGGAKATGQGIDDMLAAMAGKGPVTDAMEQNAKLMLRAMIQAAKADGEIDAGERAMLMEHLSDAAPEERAFVQAELDAPVDPVALARDTSEALKGQVYAAALTAVRVDSAAEVAFLNNLAAALGLDDATRRTIERKDGGIAA